MTTLQMEYFLALAERLSFTAVAERFFITQPTLSRQIASMEQELHTKLFIRDKNSVKLTPAGEELYSGLKTIYKQYSTLARRVEQTGESCPGKLSVGLAEEQMMSAQVSHALAEFHQRYPNVTITIRRGTFQELRVGLLEGYFDVANALYMKGGFLNDLEYSVISQDAVYLAAGLKSAAGLSHTLTRETAAAFFNENTLILAAPDSFVMPEESHLEGCRKLFGFQPPSIRFEGNLSSIPAYVESDLGVTIANQTHVLSINPYAVLLHIPHSKPYLKILAYHPQPKNALAQEFIALVQKEVGKKRHPI